MSEKSGRKSQVRKSPTINEKSGSFWKELHRLIPSHNGRGFLIIPHNSRKKVEIRISFFIKEDNVPNILCRKNICQYEHTAHEIRKSRMLKTTAKM
jgi:hypothetical protein